MAKKTSAKNTSAKKTASPSKRGGRKAADFLVRTATLGDVDAIVELNRAAYPNLAELEMVWQPQHVAAHVRTFPEGQGVVEREGRIVAACSSLVVSLGRDPYRDHTWAGITDNGMFYNHDPFGDTLYGADVNVHPDFQRKGLASRLYDFRRELCRRLNLRRIVLGGRLAHYAQVSEHVAPEEYARLVESGSKVDPVLSFQLKRGFTLKKVMPRYLRDPESRDYGTFLEWINPNYRSRPRKAQAVRVSSVQYQMRRIADFEGFAQQVRFFVDVAKGYDSDYVLFPELLTAQLMSYIRTETAAQGIRKLADLTPKVDALFTGLAREFQITIIGGTHPIRTGDVIHNVASLYLRDGAVHRQPKIHITPSEARHWGIQGGDFLKVFDTGKARIGILICYDSEFPEAARYLADQGAEVIFVPFCTDDRQAYLRVRYCSQARAVENQVYVVMSGTVGNLPDVENMDLNYAQSCVLSPSDFEFARDGILVEAQPNTETVITTDLDFEALHESIRSGSVRQRNDRRPDLFRMEALFDKTEH